MREAARYVQQKYAISASRVCRVLGLARSTFDYKEHLSFPKFSGHFLKSGVTLRKEHCYGEEDVQSRV
jgi:hypothetical protein